jgi:hypothetical protein
MRLYFSVFVLILACTLTAFAQGDKKNGNVLKKPDPTGSWMLDPKRSNVGKSAQPDLPLKITYRDPELRIKRIYDHNGQTVEREFIYYSDGRGETNPATMILSTTPDKNARDLDNQVTNSKTRWNGNKLVTRSIIRNPIAGHMLEFEFIDEWKLSEDGKTLTQTSRTVFRPGSDSVFIPANVPDPKRVYNRVPDSP